jgi:hypothetical protein
MRVFALQSFSTSLADLEVVAYDIARGRPHDAPRVIASLDARSLQGGAPLLTILRRTVGRVASCPTARRQFFHAARALVALHRVGMR